MTSAARASTPPSASPSSIICLPDGVELRLTDVGAGRPILLLHGGAGPRTMASLAAALAPRARVLTPTHPGFALTARPAWLDRVEDIALVYADLLEQLDLRDVLVIGQSLGGWIGSELALRSPARVSGVIVVNGAGIQVDGHEIAQLAGLTPAQIGELAYFEPAKFRIDPSTLDPDELAAFASNRAAMAVYTGAPHPHDPKLGRRLRRAVAPALVVWGEADRIVDLDYGRAWAAAFTRARFVPIAGAAHFPQLEQPARVLELVEEFARETGAPLAS